MSKVADILASKAKLAKPPAHLTSAKAKAEIVAYGAKRKTKAKTANTPESKKKLAAKIKEAKTGKTRLNSPGELARCRAIAGGDWRAAMLLYRVAHLWRAINPKLIRHGVQWIAMTREDWAMSSGLGVFELRDYALPRLRKYGHGIVRIEANGRGADKKLWVHLDKIGFAEAVNEAAHELKVAAAMGALTCE